MTFFRHPRDAISAGALIMACLLSSVRAHSLTPPIQLPPNIAALNRIAANHARRAEQWGDFGVTFRIVDHKIIRLRTILVLRLEGRYEDEGFRGVGKPRKQPVTRRLVLRYHIDLTRVRSFTTADTHAWIEVMCKDRKPCVRLDIRTPAGRSVGMLHGADAQGTIAGFGRANKATLVARQGSLIDALNRVSKNFNGLR